MHLVKETFPLLEGMRRPELHRKRGGPDIPFGACDVAVSEAFAGNIVLKMYEGTHRSCWAC